MAEKKSQYTSTKTLLFVVILCFISALILSILAYLLREPQQKARELYKSKQLLRAAGLLSYNNVFLLDGEPAQLDQSKGILVATPDQKLKATDQEVLSLFSARILTRLTNEKGELFTFKQAQLNKKTYLKDHAKQGYAKLKYKLIYIAQPNLPKDSLSSEQPPYGYVIPINGYGLWDAIYGYLGLKADANTILGMSWYDQKETPGLGGNIALPHWQKQFENKVIFQKKTDGKTNYERAELGIKVVKTTVEQTYGNTPLAKSAVDGIAGASITVVGVNEAIRNSLEPYRPFLIKAHKQGINQ